MQPALPRQPIRTVNCKAQGTGDFETANKIRSEIKRREESDREANKDEVRKRDEMRRNPKTDTRTPEQVQQEEEAKRKQIRDIASEGRSKEESKKIAEGFLAGGTTTADEEAIKTADTLLFNAGREDVGDEFKANRRKAAGTIVDKIIDGEFQASNEQMGSLADRAEQTGDAGTAKKIRDEIARREESDRIAAEEKQTRNQTTGLFPAAPAGVSGPISPIIPGANMPGAAGRVGAMIGGAVIGGLAAPAAKTDDQRFNEAERDLPDAFKKMIAGETDPEIRKIMEQSKLGLSQVANAKGGFDPQVALQELGDMTQKRGVQETDMANLGRLVQGNIDEQVQREQQKKILEAQEKIREFAKQQNEKLGQIVTNTGKPREAVIAGN